MKPLCRGSIVAIIWLCMATGVRADPDRALLRQVVQEYGRNNELIRSIECDYVVSFGGVERRCRYARDGERIYHASIDVTDTGFYALPSEAAWDGQTATRRVDPRLMSRSRKQNLAKPSCPSPEQALNTYLAQALGYEPRPNHVYRLVSSRRVQHEGQDCIELEFDAVWLGARLTSLHARAFNYAPIAVVLRHPDARASYELRDVRYVTRRGGEAAVYYPVQVTSISRPAGGETKMIYRVDEKTLKLNEPIPPSRFVLEPWPNQSVSELDKGTTVKAKDRTWSPEGAAEFPFDLVRAAMRKSPISGNDAVAEQRAVVARQERMTQWMAWSVVALGVVALAAVAWWRLRQSRGGVPS